MLWLNDKVLKQYTNGKWVTVTLDILKMDEVLKTTINSIKETLGNISADGKLSFIDRKVISQNVGEIIGEMPSTSKTSMTVLPAYTVLDSKGVGTFSFLRSTALSVGITKDDTVYKEMELTYKNLASYLASTNPKMWDITDANEEKVITLSNTDDFNGYFLNYFLAEAGMSAEIDKRANELMLKITEGAKSGVVVKDIEGIELYTEQADLNGALDIVVEGGTDNLAPIDEGRNLAVGTSNEYRTTNPTTWYRTIHTVDADEYGLTSGDQVTLKMYIKATGTYGGLARLTMFSDGSNNKQTTAGNVISGGNEGYSELTYTLNEKNKKIEICIQNENSGSTSSEVEYKEVKLEKGKTATPWTPAPEDMKTPNLVSANNFNLVSQMGKFKNISNREDTKEITDIWTKYTTTTEVLNEPYTSERYPYLNIRKVGFKDISMIFRPGGEQFSEGVRGGKYTYVMYIKPLTGNLRLTHNGLNSPRGVIYTDGVRSTYSGGGTFTKGKEYLLIVSFTHRGDYDFWQFMLNNHSIKNPEIAISNFMLFDGDVVSEIEGTLPGVGTILNPDDVTGTPDWAKISSSYVELPQPLRDAGNGVRDQLRRNDDGRWEIYRRVNEFELQDTLGLLVQDVINNTIRITSLYGYTGKNALGRNYATGNVTGLKSSHFTYSSSEVTARSSDWTIGMNGNSGAWAHNLRFKLPTQYGTVQAFKDFATAEAKKGNPIRVVYELREPYVEALSDEVQITLDKVFTYPHSNSIYTVFPGLDKAYNHPHPYLKANFLGGADGTRRRTESDLNDKANQEDVDKIGRASCRERV